VNQYRLTPAAQRDLSSSWDCTEERWDIVQAETYVREIQSAIVIRILHQRMDSTRHL